MKYLMIIMCLMLVFLAGCDKREGEQPILSVIPGLQPLYNVANHDTVSVVCQMAGSNSLIANQKINVTYDSLKVLFVGSGSANYLMTNSQGYAQGFFKVENNYYGDVLVKFSPDHFPLQAKSIVLQPQDMPRVHAVIASDTTLTSINAISNITVSITSRSDNINNKWIHFTSSGTGTNMEFNTVKTDTLGVVHNVFHRNSFIGDSIISAYLEIYPDDPATHHVTAHCQ